MHALVALVALGMVGLSAWWVRHLRAARRQTGSGGVQSLL